MAFCENRLDAREEAELALQVARIYTCEPLLPNLTVGLLGRMTKHLGGPGAVLDWLSGFPGEASLVAAVVRLNDLLGALSGSASVLDAIQKMRSRRGYRDPFQAYWAPSTDHVTLSDLAEGAKYRLRRRDQRGAYEISVHVLDLLDEALALVDADGGDASSARGYVDEVRRALDKAVLSPELAAR
jgi:hypothetical protein